jgi:membrane-associated phospholipid phosphatase
MRVQKWYQDDVRSQKTDDYNIVFKELGNGKILIPLFLSSALIFENFRNTKTDHIIGEWSRRNLRSFLVGAPIMLTLQVVTGASRPNETISNWNPFSDDNGVSGHAFMGAVPFLNAAEMTDNLSLKLLFYSGSFLTGYSRINDNKHYLSQTVLGWFMAYLSSTNLTGKDHFSVSSSYIKNDVMITAEYRF